MGSRARRGAEVLRGGEGEVLLLLAGDLLKKHCQCLINQIMPSEAGNWRKAQVPPAAKLAHRLDSSR